MRIKDWARFQHYKTGKNASKAPDWIKLYGTLLDDVDWHELDGEAAKALVMMWLVASEDSGNLPCIKKLAFRLRITEQKCKSLINKLSHWIETDDKTVLGTSYDIARLEENKKEEEKVEGEGEVNGPIGPSAPNGATSAKAFENWNVAAPQLSLAKAQSLTPERAKKLRVLLAKFGLEGWNRALQNIAEMPFCQGENDRNWRVTIDWLLKPPNFMKILEMTYEKPINTEAN